MGSTDEDKRALLLGPGRITLAPPSLRNAQGGRTFQAGRLAAEGRLAPSESDPYCRVRPILCGRALGETDVQNDRLLPRESSDRAGGVDVRGAPGRRIRKSRRRRRRVGGTYDRSRPANHCRGSGYRWSDCKCAAAANEIEKSGVLVRACIPTIFLDSYSRERPTDHSDRNLGGLDTNNCSYGLLLLETRRSISLSDIFGRSRDYHAIRYVFYVCDKINKMEIVTNLKFYQ